MLVDDYVLAAFGRAGVRDDSLPPGERGLAFIALQAQVGGDDVFATGWNQTGCRLLSRISGPLWPTIGG